MRGVTYSKLVFLDSQDGVRGAKALRPTSRRVIPANRKRRVTPKKFDMSDGFRV